MASRRLLDSCQHVPTRRTANYAYFHFKTLLLSLALVSCLISIKCASYGHRSTAHQALHRQPEYHLFSKDEPNDDSISLEDLIGQSNRQRDAESSSSSIDYSPQSITTLDEPSSRYYYSSQVSRNPPRAEFDSLYHQLAQQLRTDQAQQQLGATRENSPPGALNSANDDEFVGQFDQINEASKLVDLLQRSRVNNLDRGYVFLDKPAEIEYSPTIITDPKISLSLPVDQSSEPIVDVNGSQLDKESQRQLVSKVTASHDSERSHSSGSSYDKRDDESGKFTTLLEDEEKQATGVDSRTSQVKPTDDVSYGTIIKADTSESTVQDPSDGEKTSKADSTSVFSRMYKNLTRYLPFFNQIDILNGNVDNQKSDEKTNIANEKEATKLLVENKHENNEAKLSSTNHSVGTSKSESLISTGGNFNGGANNDSISEANSKDNMKDNKEVDKKGLPKETKTESDNNMSSSLISSSRFKLSSGEHQQGGQTYSDDSYGNIMQGSIDKPGMNIRQGGEHRVQLMRQSGLVMPYDQSHDVLAATSNPSGTLVGKFIYAPDHRYLTSPAGGLVQNQKALDLDDDLYAAHRSYSRRIQPELYAAHAGLGPMYASQAVAPDGLIGNKSNDIYFLVMVVAFCAMAMTVVFAAGLFAYRIQQSRKTSSETDYPTYGVVGPNNMNGKGGAASFVGGYFGNIANAGSLSSGSKNGSAKHLPDSHSQSDSGVASSGKSIGKRASNEQNSTGSSRLDFMTNQNAARMYLYQHQKQQMIISDSASNGRHTSASDLDSEDENDDGSYTVYECPGLASAHEMEIKNPLFNDDRTP